MTCCVGRSHKCLFCFVLAAPCNPPRLQTYASCFAAELFSVLLRVYHEHRLCNFSTSYMSCRMSCRMPMLGGHTATPWLRPRSCNGPHRGKNACRFAMQLFKRYGWCTIFCQLRFDRSIHVWLSLPCILFWFVAPRSPNVNVDWQNIGHSDMPPLCDTAVQHSVGCMPSRAHHRTNSVVATSWIDVDNSSQASGQLIKST